VTGAPSGRTVAMTHGRGAWSQTSNASGTGAAGTVQRVTRARFGPTARRRLGQVGGAGGRAPLLARSARQNRAKGASALVWCLSFGVGRALKETRKGQTRRTPSTRLGVRLGVVSFLRSLGGSSEDAVSVTGLGDEHSREMTREPNGPRGSVRPPVLNALHRSQDPGERTVASQEPFDRPDWAGDPPNDPMTANDYPGQVLTRRLEHEGVASLGHDLGALAGP
jgi:hypothetical protein